MEVNNHGNGISMNNYERIGDNDSHIYIHWVKRHNNDKPVDDGAQDGRHQPESSGLCHGLYGGTDGGTVSRGVQRLRPHQR